MKWRKNSERKMRVPCFIIYANIDNAHLRKKACLPESLLIPFKLSKINVSDKPVHTSLSTALNTQAESFASRGCLTWACRLSAGSHGDGSLPRPAPGQARDVQAAPNVHFSPTAEQHHDQCCHRHCNTCDQEPGADR